MAEKKIGAKIVLDGEKEYREALKNINTAQKEMRSEMKLCNTQYADTQNSLKALTEKEEILTKQIDSQKQKVEIYTQAVEASNRKQEDAKKKVDDLSAQYERAAKELEVMRKSSDTSNSALEEQEQLVSSLKSELLKASDSYNAAERSTSSWKTSLNNAQADLKTMENDLQKTGQYLDEARKSSDGCATSIDNLGKSTQEAEKGALKLGDVLTANIASGAIIAGIGKIAELAKEAGMELLECANNAAKFADDIQTMSVQTGVSVSTLQELTYAEELMDVSVETVTSSMAKNIKSMTQAKKGSADYAEAYRKLGVQITTANGQFRDSEKVYWEVVDALGKVTNETERDSIAMTLFGKKAQDLNTLIEIGSAGFAEFAQEAHEVGYVMDDEMMDALLNTSDAMERMNKKIDAAKNKLGVELAPVLEDAYGKIGDAVTDLSDDVISFAEDAIPVVINSIEWLLNNSDAVLTAVTGIGAAIAVHKTAGPAVDFIKSAAGAWKVYAAETENATAVQWLLNAAQNASPVFWITTAIVALTGAVVAYKIATEDEVTENERVIETFKDLQDEIKKSEEAYQKISAEISGEKVNNEALLKSLTQLYSEENKTATQKKQITNIVNSLNSSMEELNLSYDEENDALSMSVEQLQSYNDALATQEQYTEDVARMNELLVEREEIQKSLAESQEALNTEKTTNIYSAEWLQLSEQVETLNEDLQNNIEEYDELEKKCSSYNSQLEALTETQKESVDVTVQYKDMQYTLVGTTQEVADAISQLQTSYEEAKTAAYDSISSQVGLFEELSTQSDLTVQQMATNLKTQTDTFNQYTEDLNTAAALMSTSASPEFNKIVQSLMDMGIDGAGYLHELVTAAQEDSTAFNEVLSEFGDMETAKEELSNTIADMQTNYSEGMDGYLGIQTTKNDEKIKNEQDTADSIEKIVTDSNDTIVEDMSTTMTELNTAVVEGTPIVEEAMTSAADAMIQATNSALGRLEGQSPKFKEIGKGVMEDLADGISSGSSLVGDALQQSIQTAVDSMDISGLVEKIDKQLGEAFSG